MARRSRIRMKVLDMKVQDGKCVISVEIRKGVHTWNKAYGFDAGYLQKWDFEQFKARIHADAVKLVEDQAFEEKVLRSIEDLMNVQIYLD